MHFIVVQDTINSIFTQSKTKNTKESLILVECKKQITHKYELRIRQRMLRIG